MRVQHGMPSIVHSLKRSKRKRKGKGKKRCRVIINCIRFGLSKKRRVNCGLGGFVMSFMYVRAGTSTAETRPAPRPCRCRASFPHFYLPVRVVVAMG